MLLVAVYLIVLFSPGDPPHLLYYLYLFLAHIRFEVVSGPLDPVFAIELARGMEAHLDFLHGYDLHPMQHFLLNQRTHLHHFLVLDFCEAMSQEAIVLFGVRGNAGLVDRVAKDRSGGPSIGYL